MFTPYFTAEQIGQLADVRELARRLALEYTSGLEGIEVPQRVSILRENPFTAFDTMPAFSDRHKLFIAKIGAVVPQSDPAQPSVHAVGVAFSGETGRPLAILDGGALTRLKCAAVTAFVTDLCAPPETEVLAVIGSGVQACEQIRGVGAVRRLRQIRVYSRNGQRVLQFIRENEQYWSDVEFIACPSAKEAVAGADVISTATTSIEPVLSREDLSEGKSIHINCIGNHTPQSREIPLSVLQNSLLIVEDVPTAVLEAGEVHRSAMTLQQLVHWDTADLRQQRTVFASTGHAFLDLVTVAYLLEKFNYFKPSISASMAR